MNDTPNSINYKDSIYLAKKAGFFNLLANKDFLKAQQDLEPGFWGDTSWWHDLMIHASSVMNTKEGFDFLWNLSPEQMPSNIKKYYIHETHSNENEDLINIYKKKIVHSFISKQYGVLSQEMGIKTLNWIEKGIPEINYLVPPEIAFKTLLGSIVNTKFSNIPHLLDRLFTHHKNEFLKLTLYSITKENHDYLINHPKYNSAIITHLKGDAGEFCMLTAMRSGNIPMMKIMRELGFKYPTKKEPYSVIFASPTKKEAIKYIIETIDDIAVGDQVILKTLLHMSQKVQGLDELIPHVLERYNENQLKLLPEAIDKRKPCKGVDTIKGLIEIYNNKLTIEALLIDKVKAKHHKI